jgi:hypothetical protein
MSILTAEPALATNPTPAVANPAESQPPQPASQAVAATSSPAVPASPAAKPAQPPLDRPVSSADGENPPVKTKREQRVSIVQDGRLVETVVSREGRFQFAVSGKPQPVDSFEDRGKQIDPPYHLRAMWETRLMTFPSHPAPYGSTVQLVDEVEKFICRYANVPKEWLDIIPIYILMTWVYDRFTAVPYLRFLGEPGTGKTRLLQLCAATSYKGTIVSGSITGPALFRTINMVRGTMAVDEGDFKHSEEWSDITKVLNNGYTTGLPIVRCERTGNVFEPHAIHVYGPKIISTRSRFSDEALESRCLTFETREEPLPEHIPLQLPLSFEQEACAIRNKLLQWRFDNFHRIEAREKGMRHLVPRSGQIGASLAAVAPTEESRARLIAFLSRNDAGRRENSPKAIVLQALEQTRALGVSTTKVSSVANMATILSKDLGGDELSPRKTGGILRSLGIIPRRTNSGYLIDLSEHAK